MKNVQVTAKFYNPYEITLVGRGEAGKLGLAVRRAIDRIERDPRSWKRSRSIKRIVFAVDLLK